MNFVLPTRGCVNRAVGGRSAREGELLKLFRSCAQPCALSLARVSADGQYFIDRTSVRRPASLKTNTSWKPRHTPCSQSVMPLPPRPTEATVRRRRPNDGRSFCTCLCVKTTSHPPSPLLLTSKQVVTMRVMAYFIRSVCADLVAAVLVAFVMVCCVFDSSLLPTNT